MIKILIGIVVTLIIAILIWIFINRNIIKKVIKYTWAHYAVMYGKFEKDDIDYDDLIEKK